MDSDLAQALNSALTELQKSLKAITFYPERHPVREEILNKAYRVIISTAKERTLSIIVRRNGISFADHDVAVDKNPMTTALGKELFAREVQQLTITSDLTYQEFTGFLSILAMEPHSIIDQGGLADILDKMGIRSVIANEIDITTVYTKKMTGATSGESLADGESSRYAEETVSQEFELPEIREEDLLSDLSMEELIARMDMESDDDKYRLMAGFLPGKGEILKAGKEFDRLFEILPQLLKQNDDARKSSVKRECALLVYKQITLGALSEHLLDQLEDEHFSHKEIAFTILYRLEGDIVDAVIRRLMSAGEQPAGKTLISLLVRIGPPAVPSITRMLKDNNWQNVRTAVVILGEMGYRETVSDLMVCAYHNETRVRMEAIRSLARIGGREATLLLLDLMEDINQSIRIQTIIWLGITKNEKSLEKLLRLVMKYDISGKLHSLKKETVIAIGRIGDRRALEPLCKLVRKKRFVSSERWEELKIIAIEAIGRVGGEYSREFLEKMEKKGGHIGKACSAALTSLDHLEENHATAVMECSGEMERGVIN